MSLTDGVPAGTMNRYRVTLRAGNGVRWTMIIMAEDFTMAEKHAMEAANARKTGRTWGVDSVEDCGPWQQVVKVNV